MSPVNASESGGENKSLQTLIKMNEKLMEKLDEISTRLNLQESIQSMISRNLIALMENNPFETSIQREPHYPDDLRSISKISNVAGSTSEKSIEIESRIEQIVNRTDEKINNLIEQINSQLSNITQSQESYKLSTEASINTINHQLSNIADELKSSKMKNDYSRDVKTLEEKNTISICTSSSIRIEDKLNTIRDDLYSLKLRLPVEEKTDYSLVHLRSLNSTVVEMTELIRSSYASIIKQQSELMESIGPKLKVEDYFCPLVHENLMHVNDTIHQVLTKVTDPRDNTGSFNSPRPK